MELRLIAAQNNLAKDLSGWDKDSESLAALKKSEFRYNNGKYIKEFHHILLKPTKRFCGRQDRVAAKISSGCAKSNHLEYHECLRVKIPSFKPTSFAGKRYGKFPLLVKFEAQTRQV